MPHQLNTGSSSSTTSSFMWKVNRVLETFNWNILYCVYTSSLYFFIYNFFCSLCPAFNTSSSFMFFTRILAHNLSRFFHFCEPANGTPNKLKKLATKHILFIIHFFKNI